MQDEIEAIWREEKKTVVLVTNDVDEALLLADRIIPLTPGPRATLGPEFRVNLPRPRDRKAVNHDPQYRQLRAAITQYLLHVEAEKPVPAEGAVTAVVRSLRQFPAEGDARQQAEATVQPDNVEFYNVHKSIRHRGPLPWSRDSSSTSSVANVSR